MARKLCLPSFTWVMLGEARQGLGRVHANIVFGEDDLAVQAWAQRRPPGSRVKGQEVGGLGGGAPQEPTERHLLRRGNAGSILWGAEEAGKVNNGLTSRNISSCEKEQQRRLDAGEVGEALIRPCTIGSTAPALPSGVTHGSAFTAVSFLPAASPLLQLRLSLAVCSRREQIKSPATFSDDCTRTANTLGSCPCEIPSIYRRPGWYGHISGA